MTKEQEIVVERKVSCNGGDTYGHPMIYMEISTTENFAECPYCSKVFIIKSEEK